MSQLTAAIDLAALPQVEYVAEHSHDKITEDTLAWIKANYDITLTGAESPDYRIIRACNYREMLLRREYNRACLQLTLKHATGEHLDHLGATYHRTTRKKNEKDETYRKRIALAPEARSVAGPPGSYVWHVKAVDPTIRDVSAQELALGEVGLYVLTNTGTLSAALKRRIEAVVMDQSVDRPQAVRPMAIRVSVLACEMLDYTVTATLKIAKGVKEAAVIKQARAAALAYTDRQMRIGDGVVRSMLNHVMHVPSVTQVTLAGWRDVAANLTQAPRCTAINITTAS